MKGLRAARQRAGLSQRGLASLAGLAYKSIQLIESERHDARISTLKQLARALGYPPSMIERRLEDILRAPPDSAVVVSERVREEGKRSWKAWLFNFVDAFRRTRDASLVEAPPAEDAPPWIRALLASTTETLCEEMGLPPPFWCRAMPPLGEPWFVSGVENLKATALVESPAHFRKRCLFVLGDFLSRA